MNEEIQVLEEIKRIEKKALSQSRIRTICTLFITAVVIVCAFIVYMTIQKVTVTLDQTSEILNEIKDEVKEVDIDGLNTTINNLEEISNDVRRTTDSINDVASDVSKFTGKIFR